jgi:hypothetical protein
MNIINAKTILIHRYFNEKTVQLINDIFLLQQMISRWVCHRENEGQKGACATKG